MSDHSIPIQTDAGPMDLNVLASFSLDQRDYCWIEDPETGSAVLFRFYSDKEEMVFEIVSDPDEYEEANAAYRELVE